MRIGQKQEKNAAGGMDRTGGINMETKKELKDILEEIEQEFDRRINTQLKIMAGLGDDIYRYGYGKSLEAYQQGKLFVKDIICNHLND